MENNMIIKMGKSNYTTLHDEEREGILTMLMAFHHIRYPIWWVNMLLLVHYTNQQLFNCSLYFSMPVNIFVDVGKLIDWSVLLVRWNLIFLLWTGWLILTKYDTYRLPDWFDYVLYWEFIHYWTINWFD